MVRRHAGALCVSSVTAAELRYGAAKKGAVRLTESVEFLLDLMTNVEWGDLASRRYANLRVALAAAGTTIGNMDMMIAASAIAEGCVLVSHNTEHFARVQGLELQDWA